MINGSFAPSHHLSFVFFSCSRDEEQPHLTTRMNNDGDNQGKFEADWVTRLDEYSQTESRNAHIQPYSADGSGL